MKIEDLVSAYDIRELETKGYIVLSIGEKLQQLSKNILTKGADFFHQEKAVKARNAVPELGDEGWVDTGYEYNQDKERPDLCEGFWVAPKYAEQTLKTYIEAKSLCSGMVDYAEALNVVLRDMIEKLAQELGISKTTLGNFSCERDSEVELLYYRPANHDRDLLQDPHEDGLFLTFLRPTAPGLQILTNGEYKDITVAENELLVIPGENLFLMSGGRIKPLFHRVKRYEGYAERFTLVYFTFPNVEAGTVLAPWIPSKENEGIDIMEHLRDNAYEKFALKTSQIV